MKVLVGIDGTERSFHALNIAGQILSAEKDSVCLYFSPPQLKLKTSSDIAPDLPDLARTALADSVFEKAKERLGADFRPAIETIVGDNEPHEGILAAAENIRADLIVIGAHSTKRRLPLFLGGTARKIAHRSTVPVLLVRETKNPMDGGMKVMVACDDTDRWKETVQPLAQFTFPTDTETTLFHVIEVIDDDRMAQLAKHAHPSIPDAEALLEQYRASVSGRKSVEEKRLAEGRTALPTVIQNATTKVGYGHPLEAIVDEVRESNIDLVVIGARRLSIIGRLLGSTTEGLLVQCPCSLLVVHDHEKP